MEPARDNCLAVTNEPEGLVSDEPPSFPQRDARDVHRCVEDNRFSLAGAARGCGWIQGKGRPRPLIRLLRRFRAVGPLALHEMLVHVRRQGFDALGQRLGEFRQSSVLLQQCQHLRGVFGRHGQALLVGDR